MSARTWTWADDAEAVLRRRAGRLRSPSPARQHAGRPHLLVVAGGEQYALPTGRLAGVIDPGILTPLPHSEAPWAGVTIVRGRLHPVADLSVLVTRSPVPPVSRSPIVLVQASPHGPIGLRVERTLGTKALADPVGATSHQHELILTTTPDLVHVIDMDAILSRLAGTQLTPRGTHP